MKNERSFANNICPSRNNKMVHPPLKFCYDTSSHLVEIFLKSNQNNIYSNGNSTTGTVRFCNCILFHLLKFEVFVRFRLHV